MMLLKRIHAALACYAKKHYNGLRVWFSLICFGGAMVFLGLSIGVWMFQGRTQTLLLELKDMRAQSDLQCTMQKHDSDLQWARSYDLLADELKSANFRLDAALLTLNGLAHTTGDIRRKQTENQVQNRELAATSATKAINTALDQMKEHSRQQINDVVKKGAKR